jgi:hypothetical protein
MALEDWIDEVAKLAGNVASHKGGFVRSYKVFSKSDIPEAINEYPCAVTYIMDVRAQYSLGGPCIDIWNGQTEFHLFPDIKKSNLPEMVRYFGKIRAAWAANMSLGGLVSHSKLKPDKSIEMVQLVYGVEAEHHGIMVYWEVKENVTGQFTVG